MTRLERDENLNFDLLARYVKAYAGATNEAFRDGHNAAFAVFGEVPRSILYDNSTLVMARIPGDGERQRT